MQDLKELIYFLDRQDGFKNNSVFEKDSKLNALFEGIRLGKFGSDEDASGILYPGMPESTGYRKLKSQLRSRLFEQVYEFDPHRGKDYTEYQRAYYECHRQWLIVKILAGHNANTAALSFAAKLFKQAERYELTLLCADLASYMMVQYGIRDGNDPRYREVSEQLEYYQAVYNAECQAERLYSTLIVNFVNSRATQDALHPVAAQNWEQLQTVLEKYPSGKIQLYGNIIGLMTYTLINDYVGALAHCEKAIGLFESKPYEAAVPLQIFYYQKLICHIQLKQFERGQETAAKCLAITREGTFNWFKYQEIYIQLSLHTRRYEQAFQISEQTTRHKRFGFQPDHVKESWLIFEYYCRYLGLVGKMPLPKGYKFRPGKMANELSIFSKDKSGMNIAIIIVRLLYLIYEKKYAQVIDETEAIEQYCYRHLNKPETMRSFYFVKMLLQVAAGDLKPAAVRERAQKYLDQLRKQPLQAANQTFEVEIVDFEDLWEIVLESVERREFSAG
jgi:hypothetical protein